MSHYACDSQIKKHGVATPCCECTGHGCAEEVVAHTTKKKADEQMKKYNEIMLPKRLIQQQDDKQLLWSIFSAFGGTNKSQWHIVDPVMAEVFPNSFYAKH